MTSDITLYYSEYPEVWNLEESKNFIIDGIEDYLSTKKYIKINDFMYLRAKLDLDIKVDIDQVYASNLSSRPFHYVKIEENGETYYYYIRDMEWISENAVRLRLHMDVLNTIPFNDPKGYIFGGDNIILRQHKDRVHWRNDSPSTNMLVADIDVYPEQIETLLFKDEEKVLYDQEIMQIDPEHKGSDVIPLNSPEISWYLVFLTKNTEKTTADPNEMYIAIFADVGLLVYGDLRGSTTGYADESISPFSSLDLTDPLIIKVIEIPYPPFKFIDYYTSGIGSYNSAHISIADDSDNFFLVTDYYMTGAVSPTNLICFSRSREHRYTHQATFGKELTLVDEEGANVNPVKNIFISMPYSFLRDTLSYRELDVDDSYARQLETKLLFSDFGYWRIVYDSFSLDIDYETLEAEYPYSDLKINYFLSSNPNTYILNQIINPKIVRYQTEDYSGQFIINRNNEVAIYSDEYLNYLKVGYNYDVKNKNLSLASNILGVAGNVFSPGKLANLPSMASSAFSGITSAVFSELQAENSLAKNLAEKQASTESVSGSDDIDLLYCYTNFNKYKIIHYEPLERMTRLLVKYFQVAGYATNEYGTPDMYSRTAFNFAQCNTNIESYGYLESGVKDEIINKWNGGVFMIHKYGDKYDDSLDSINIEKSLLEE